MSDTNAGPGMAPCRKGCRCNDCEIDRLTERNAELADNAADLLAAKIRLEAERDAWRETADSWARDSLARKQRADTLQAQLDAVMGLFRYEMEIDDDFIIETRHNNGRWVRYSQLQQALNAPETA